jgi:wyosine [tRNA(Phe)-imidazoG37] synthetase (radical SAM superfamily)
MEDFNSKLYLNLQDTSLVFGPIPSRRLGRSLGINNIPFKYCTYSCVYCQLGLTNLMSRIVRDFFKSNEIVQEVKNKLEELESAGEKIDYLTFVPDGEPTLDINLGKTIEKLKTLGIKIAVITNSSLLSKKEIRNELMLADWVSVKIDSAYSSVWKKINRPYGSFKLPEILDGISAFASEFKGKLVTETMLVKGINDNVESLYKTAERINIINPDKAYILVPTRPPAESYVRQPDEYNINADYQIFNNFSIDTELLIRYEGTDFTFTSDAEKELLSILAVHPMRKDAVENFLLKSGNDWVLVENLIKELKIKEVNYNHSSYFIYSN